MKTSFKSSALALVLALVSTGVFATEKAKTEAPANKKQDVVLFTSLSQDMGVGVIIHKASEGKSAIAIYDADGNSVMKDVLANDSDNVLKGYVLSKLENGKYTIQVTSNKAVTKRVVRIYNDENNQKAFFFEM